MEGTSSTSTISPARKPRRQSLRLRRLTADMDGVAAMLGVSRSFLYGQWSAAKMPMGTLLGGKRLFYVREIEAWVKAGMPARSEWESRRAAAMETARLDAIKLKHGH